MARFTASAMAVALLATGTIAMANPPKPAPPGQAAKPSDQVLMDGLNAAASSSGAQQISPQVQPGSTDKDQGDDHASQNAKDHVCNHDNPSATHSAICQPNSPP